MFLVLLIKSFTWSTLQDTGQYSEILYHTASFRECVHLQATLNILYTNDGIIHYIIPNNMNILYYSTSLAP